MGKVAKKATKKLEARRQAAPEKAGFRRPGSLNRKKR